MKKVADLLDTNIDWLCFGSGLENSVQCPRIEEFEAGLNIGIYEVVLRKINK